MPAGALTVPDATPLYLVRQSCRPSAARYATAAQSISPPLASMSAVAYTCEPSGLTTIAVPVSRSAVLGLRVSHSCAPVVAS